MHPCLGPGSRAIPVAGPSRPNTGSGKAPSVLDSVELESLKQAGGHRTSGEQKEMGVFRESGQPTGAEEGCRLGC